VRITLSVLATRDEIRDWLAYQATRFDLHFALVRYQPEYQAVALRGWDEYDQHKGAEHWREVWVGLQPLYCDSVGQRECLASNPNRLALQLPEMRPEGLREGRLGTLSGDETHLRVWRAIIRYFRTRTTAGAWVVNPSTRRAEYYKTIRYSPGVAVLHRQGLPLLPFAGSNQVYLDRPGTATNLGPVAANQPLARRAPRR
jgi:hypothetical protein